MLARDRVRLRARRPGRLRRRRGRCASPARSSSRYTRARAEALGLKGDVGIGSRAERVVVITGRARARALGRPALGDRAPHRHRLDHGRPARLSVRSQQIASASTALLALARAITAGHSLASERRARAACPPTSSAASPRGRPRGEPERRRRRDPRLPLRRPLRAERPPRRAPRASGDVLLRMPRGAEGQARAPRRGAPADQPTTSSSRPSRDGLGGSERTADGYRPTAAATGAARRRKVRVAIIGVGNCANSLLQGVEYYKDAADDQFVPGLMHVNLGGYHVSDIEFVGRVRRRQGQGRRRPRRGDLGTSERHDQVRRGRRRPA